MWLPNHKPYPKTKITVSLIPKLYAVPAEYIGVFICPAYSSKNVDTVYCLDVKTSG